MHDFYSNQFREDLFEFGTKLWCKNILSKDLNRMNFIIFAVIVLVALFGSPAYANLLAPLEASPRLFGGQESVKVTIAVAVNDALSNLNVTALPVQLQV